MLIDSHCHVDFDEFDVDRKQVIDAAHRVGVTELIVPAVSASRWVHTQQVCAQYQLHLALGLHPLFIQQHQPQHLIDLQQWCQNHSPVAIGEIGLDYVSADCPREKQRRYFSKQLIIAKQLGLPVIVHCRKAHDDCLALLRQVPVRGGIIHAFSGSIQQAEKYIEMGFLLGLGGMLTYERSRKLRALAEQIPISKIALETDAPDMVVAQHRGQRNSPEYLPLIAKALGEIKNLHPVEVGRITSDNVRKTLSLE